jgi:hypothetical protein
MLGASDARRTLVIVASPTTYFELSLPFGEGLEKARASALSALRVRAERLLEAHGQLPEATVPCTAMQFLFSLDDSGIAGVADEAVDALVQMQEFDWHDPSEIGGAVRQHVQELVAQSETVLAASRDFAVLAPPAHLAAARASVLRGARQQAELLAAFLLVLTTEDSDGCARIADRVRDLLASWDGFDAVGAQVEGLDWSDTTDANERIALALGVEGRFIDDFGLPNYRALFEPFAGTATPLLSFAQAGAKYLQPLLRTDAAGITEAASVLPIVACAVAVLDRPLPAFRVASRARELLETAWERDAASCHTVIERSVDESWRLHQAQRRLRRDLVRLARGELDEEAVVELFMTQYKRLAESGY